MKALFKIYLLVFLLSLVGAFSLTFSFMNIFREFGLMSEGTMLTASGITTVVLVSISMGITLYIVKTERKTLIGHWMKMNAAKVILGFVLLTIAFISIRAEVFLTIADMKNLVSLEWGIVGISITAFLIWQVIVMEYLEKKKPAIPAKETLAKNIVFLRNKEDFYFDASLLMNNLYLLLVNLFVLCTTTVLVYITHRKENVFSQSVVIIALLLCTNTVVALIMDILKPFNEKKELMLRETRTTNEDVKLQNAIIKETNDLLTAAEVIKGLNGIDEVEKLRLISEILEKLKGEYYEPTDT